MDPPRLRLCRDCLRKESNDSPRCAHCGSPRTISLDDTAGLNIAHIDCDAFGGFKRSSQQAYSVLSTIGQALRPESSNLGFFAVSR
jgi:hypothetical protein